MSILSSSYHSLDSLSQTISGVCWVKHNSSETLCKIRAMRFFFFSFSQTVLMFCLPWLHILSVFHFLLLQSV